MAARKLSLGARVDAGANRISNKMRAGRLTDGGAGRAAVRAAPLEGKVAASAARGAVKQRELDAVVRSVGGRSSRLVGEARAVAADKLSRTKTPLAEIRASALRGLGSSGKTLLKGALRGMLSPAGLAEEFAGRAAQHATRERFKQEAREQDKPTKSGMKRVKTKA